MKGDLVMCFKAECKQFAGCVFRVISDDFKFCYRHCLSAVKTKLHHNSDIDCLVFSISDSEDIICYVAVSRTGYTIDCPSGVFDIDRAGWKSKQS